MGREPADVNDEPGTVLCYRVRDHRDIGCPRMECPESSDRPFMKKLFNFCSVACSHLRSDATWKMSCEKLGRPATAQPLYLICAVADLRQDSLGMLAHRRDRIKTRFEIRHGHWRQQGRQRPDRRGY